MLTLTLLVIQSLLHTVDSSILCRPAISTNNCVDSSLGPGYYCHACESMADGTPCPASSDPSCPPCSVTTTSVTHTFSYNSAGSPIMVEDYNSLFGPTLACGAPTACSSSDSKVTVTTLGELGVSITSTYDEQFTIACTIDGSSYSVTADIKVECGANSSTVTPSTFDASQTFDLVPGATPKFTFVPFTSTASACPISTLASDSTAFSWSSHFIADTTNNIIQVHSSHQYARSTKNFNLIFKMGPSETPVACSLTTRCVAASVPLNIADFQDQIKEFGAATAYYQKTIAAPSITACAPVSYALGDATTRTTPSGLDPTVTVTGSTIKFAPTDPDAKLTYQFYLWLELPDSAWTKVGPIKLMVGCLNYIVPSLVQNTAFSQQIIGSQGTSNTLKLKIDETNTGVTGQYRLNLIRFSSTHPTECPSSIQQYRLTTASATLSPAPVQATVEPHSVGDPFFEITLDTTALGSYGFYVWGKDNEGRWSNEARSTNQIIVDISCGSEEIQPSQSTYHQVFRPLVSENFDLTTSIAPLLSTTKPACPVTSFVVYEEDHSTIWHQSSIMSTGGTTRLVQGQSAKVISLVIDGTSDGGKTGSISVKLVVCGNEVLALASPETFQIIREYNSSASLETITTAEMLALFALSSTVGSHEDCFYQQLLLKSDDTCSSTVPAGFPLNLPGASQNLEITLTSPHPYQEAFICLKSLGGQTVAKTVGVEICGTETALVNPGRQQISRRLLLGSGTNGFFTIKASEFNNDLRSSSVNCPLKSYSVVQLDESSNTYTPYSGSRARLSSTFDVEVSTATAGEFSFHVEGEALSGSKAHMEFKIEIYELVDESFMAKINTPPFFDKAPEAVEISQGTEPTSVQVQLPEVLDAHSNFCGVFIEGEGISSYFVSNSSNLTEWKGISQDQESPFAYSFVSNTLTISVPAIRAQKWTTQTLTLTLIDQYEASTSYLLLLRVAAEEGQKTSNQEKNANNNEGEGSSSGNESLTPPKEPTTTTKEFSASIASLNEYGELTLEFSEPLKAISRDLASINSNDLDVTLKPHNNWPSFSEDGASGEKLAFTWRITAVREATATIQIDWQSPSSLSPLVELDRFRLKIKEPSLFVSAESLLPLSPASRELQEKVPRQIKKTVLVGAVDSAAQMTKAVLQGATWCALAINMVLSGFLNMMLGMINSLQLIIHLPIFNVAFPPNAYMVFETLIPIVTFDLLEAFEEEVDYVLDLLGAPGSEELEEVPQQFQNVGFESFRPAPNLGTLGVLTLLYIVKVFVYVLVRLVQIMIGKRIKLAEVLKSQLFFSEILLIFIEGFLDFTLVAFLFLSSAHDQEPANWTAFFFIATLAFGVVPVSLLWVGRQSNEIINQEDFRERWGVLYEDIQTKEVGQRLFFLVFVLRRTIYVGAAFLMINHPSLELIILNLSNLGILIYQGSFKPIQSRLRNLIEATNEFFMCICSLQLMAFTDAVESSETRLLYGWVLVGTIGLHIVFNFGIILKSCSREFSMKASWGYRWMKTKLGLGSAGPANLNQMKPPSSSSSPLSESSPSLEQTFEDLEFNEIQKSPLPGTAMMEMTELANKELQPAPNQILESNVSTSLDRSKAIQLEIDSPTPLVSLKAKASPLRSSSSSSSKEPSDRPILNPHQPLRKQKIMIESKLKLEQGKLKKVILKPKKPSSKTAKRKKKSGLQLTFGD